MKTMKPFINGQFIDSQSEKYNRIFDPSTGNQIAQVPACTAEEVESAIAAAKAAFPAWSATPVRKRAQLMLRLRELIQRDRDELVLMCATENGFEIAEEDMKLRGPGDLEGTQQSGLPITLNIASLAKDGLILSDARTYAEYILEADPTLTKPGHEILAAELRKDKYNLKDFSQIS